MRIRNLVYTSIFIALCFVGAQIKIMGSIAFDSMAGFLGALILGPAYGALIGAIGHLLTAATSGFYMTLPVHLIIMVGMAGTMYAFGISYKYLSKKNKTIGIIVSSIIGILINGPIATLMIVPILGKGVIALIPVLSLAAVLNVFIAHLVYKFLPEGVKLWK
jgi:uncharacterized membrane protein